MPDWLIPNLASWASLWNLAKVKNNVLVGKVAAFKWAFQKLNWIWGKTEWIEQALSFHIQMFNLPCILASVVNDDVAFVEEDGEQSQKKD